VAAQPRARRADDSLGRLDDAVDLKSMLGQIQPHRINLVDARLLSMGRFTNQRSGI